MDLDFHNMELDLNLAYLNKYIQDSDEEVEQEDDDEEEMETKVFCSNESSLRQGNDFSEDDDYDESASIDCNQSQHEVPTGFDANGLEACLVSNQIYQEYVIDVISQLENALQANKEKQDQLQEDLYVIVNDDSTNSKYHRFPKVSRGFAAPYFRDENDFFCPKNEDYKIKRANKELENYTYQSVAWKKKDCEDLRKAVKTIALKGLLEPLMERKSNLITRWEQEKTGLEATFPDDEERRFYKESFETELASKIKDIDDEIVKISNYSDKTLFSNEILKKWEIDWYHISINVIQSKYSDVSCRLMWKYFVNPCVNNDPWTDEEEDKLRELIEEYEGRDWDLIAQELESDRSALACFIHFHRNMISNPVLPGSFSREDKRKLHCLVAKYTVDGNILWPEIFPHFPGISHPSLKNQYHRLLVKDANRSFFTNAEDLLIFLCHLKYGRRFNKYIQHLPNRNGHQIGNRYRCSIEYRFVKRFSLEDDKKLIKLVKQHLDDWALIGKEFPGLIVRQLRSRFNIILTYIPDVLEKIDDPAFVWPNIPSLASKNLFMRRVFFCNYIRAKLEYLRSHKGGKAGRYFRGPKSLKKFYPNHYDENYDIAVPRISEVELDFMISEVSIICRNSLDVETKNVKTKVNAERMERIEESVDNEINQLFYQSFELLNFYPKRTGIHKMFGGFREAQYNASCNALHHALSLKRLAPKTEDTQSENSDEEVVYTSRRLLKHQERQLELATRVVGETCYDLTTVNDLENEKYPKSVLQPTLDVLQSFQILVTERTRMARMAIGITSPDIVHSIIGKSIILCPACKLAKQRRTSDNADLDDLSGNSDLESEVKSQWNRCLCEELRRLRQGYNILRRRFVCIFFWPGLLSILKPIDGDLVSPEERDEVDSLKHKYIMHERTPTGKRKARPVKCYKTKHQGSMRIKAAMIRMENLTAARIRAGLIKKRPVEGPEAIEEPDIPKPPRKKRRKYVPPPDIIVRKSSRLNK